MTLHVRPLAQALVFSLLVFVAGASPHARADWTRPMTCSTAPGERQVADVEFKLTVTVENGMGTDAKVLLSFAVSEDAVETDRALNSLLAGPISNGRSHWVADLVSVVPGSFVKSFQLDQSYESSMSTLTLQDGRQYAVRCSDVH